MLGIAILSTMQDAAAATGNGTPAKITQRQGQSVGVLTAQVTGTFSATITWEGTLGVSSTQSDNTWVSVPAENVATGMTATTATTTGVYRINAAGFSQIRARISAYTSGTVTVMGQTGQYATSTPSAPLQAGENVIGLMGASDTVIDLTATLDTSAYAAGDVLFDTQELANAARVTAGVTILQSIVVLDEDDQTAAAMDFYFFNANTSLGTENSAPSITDANARTLVGRVSLAAADFTDLGGSKLGVKTGIELVMKADTAQTSLWVAAVTQGTPTQTASGIRCRFGFLRS